MIGTLCEIKPIGQKQEQKYYEHCAVVGINWGDEGKGRMVDLIAKDYDIVIRYQGGNTPVIPSSMSTASLPCISSRPAFSPRAL